MPLSFTHAHEEREQLRRGKHSALVVRSAAQFGRATLRSAILGNGSKRIVGCAVPYDSLSDPLMDMSGKFRERYRPGCFGGSLNGGDLRVCANHDTFLVLGRQSAGTARFFEQPDGLWCEADVPPTQWAADLCVSIDRNDICSMSAGFWITRETWSTQNGERVRTVESGKLQECSVVSIPAYPTSTATLDNTEDSDADFGGSLLMAASADMGELALRRSEMVNNEAPFACTTTRRAHLRLMKHIGWPRNLTEIEACELKLLELDHRIRATSLAEDSELAVRVDIQKRQAEESRQYEAYRRGDPLHKV